MMLLGLTDNYVNNNVFLNPPSNCVPGFQSPGALLLVHACFRNRETATSMTLFRKHEKADPEERRNKDDRSSSHRPFKHNRTRRVSLGRKQLATGGCLGGLEAWRNGIEDPREMA